MTLQKKNQYGYSNHCFRAGWLQDGKAKPVCEKSAKSENRASEVSPALQWAFLTNMAAVTHTRESVSLELGDRSEPGDRVVGPALGASWLLRSHWERHGHAEHVLLLDGAQLPV